MASQRTKRAIAREEKRQGRDVDPRFAQSPGEVTYVAPKEHMSLTAKNNNQREALRMLNEGRKLVVLRGSSGTGKSLLCCYRAAKQLKDGAVKKVYLVRPAVPMGRTVGYAKGTVEEKLGYFFAQTKAHLESFLGKGYVTYCFEKKVIEMVACEYIRGMSFENCVVIVEESQNFTFEEMNTLLTRIGDNCQMILTGDESQNDITKQGVGLSKVVKMIDHTLQTHPEYMDQDDIDVLDEDFGVVTFTPDDIVRSGLCKAFVKMFHYA